MKKELTEEKIRLALDEIHSIHRQEDGSYSISTYPCYDDRIAEKNVIKILESRDIKEAFEDKVMEIYDDSEWFNSIHEIKKEVKDKLETSGYPEGLTDEEDDLLEDTIQNLVYLDYPFSHYLDQTYSINIMVDTGDGNYDYVLNAVYPSYCGRYGDTINDKASIVWLTKQQGYTKSDLNTALRQDSPEGLNKFLVSMRQEIVNIASHMQTLTFLVEMTLGELISLNELIRLQERNGRCYDNSQLPYCGYVILDKRTYTGLYDPWNGGGSLFEIELEKDVRLPVRFIRSALPDGEDGYAVSEVYGMCWSAWKKGKVNKIHAPKKVA